MYCTSIKKELEKKKTHYIECYRYHLMKIEGVGSSTVPTHKPPPVPYLRKKEEGKEQSLAERNTYFQDFKTSWHGQKALKLDHFSQNRLIP